MAWRGQWSPFRLSYGTTHSEEVRESWRDLLAEQAHEITEDEEARRAETDELAGEALRDHEEL